MKNYEWKSDFSPLINDFWNNTAWLDLNLKNKNESCSILTVSARCRGMQV